MTKKSAAAAAARTRIRAATPADLPRLRDILNTEILTSTTSWTTVARSPGEMSAWFDDRLAGGFPVLVAECPGGQQKDK